MKKKTKHTKPSTPFTSSFLDVPVWKPSVRDWEYVCRNPSCNHNWKTLSNPECCPACGKYNFKLVIKEVTKGESGRNEENK